MLTFQIDQRRLFLFPTAHHLHMAATEGPSKIHVVTPDPEPVITEYDALDLPSPEICVICLDRVCGRATALPCGHDDFHFPCLGTWLQRQKRCPLCKERVCSVSHRNGARGDEIFYLPQHEGVLRVPQRSSCSAQRLRSQQRTHRSRATTNDTHYSSDSKGELEDQALALRRHVYANNLYSLHVGSNRHSQYLPSGSITPDLFIRYPKHISRARAFIRRELRVFNFLDPDSSEFPSAEGRSNSRNVDGVPRRKPTNCEFLLEYIIAILRAIPLKGSEGQAEALITEYLGVHNSRLFLHELESWLKSPLEEVEEWDEVVQYPNRTQRS